MTMPIVSRRALRVGIAGALALSTVAPAAAAPVLTLAAAVRDAVPDRVTEVRWRRGGAVAAGVIGGLALGAAIAASRPYYGARYYYGPGYRAPPYYYYGSYGPPAVYEPYSYRYYAPPGYPSYYQGRPDTNGFNNW